MKVYELSKKYNISDKEMIKVLKTLKVESDKELDSFTSLTVKDIKSVEKHFSKGASPKPSAKDKTVDDKTEFLIVKKGKEDSGASAKAKESSEKENKESPPDKSIATQEKKAVRVSKKVVVKKKKKDIPSKDTAPAEMKKPADLKHRNAAKPPAHASQTPDKRKVGASSPAHGKDKSKSDKDMIHINKGNKPQQPFAGQEVKKDNTHWKKKTEKRYQREQYKGKKEEKEKQIYKKKSQQKEVKASSIPKSIEIMDTIRVSDLAKKLNVKASEIIAKLISMGVMATINQVIDSETAIIIASEYSCETKIVSLYEETVIEEIKDKDEDLISRPPIVTVMGHVDHGKTKLLDAIRESDVVAGEAGGITQHIGAYQISVGEQSVVFLDTPGHEAFTAMRSRGAKVTDIVVLVVAADDGVMPQTVEAINHAKEAEVPIVVAINKMDSEKANPDRVKQQLSDMELVPEEWGGKTIMVEVSALKRTNLDKLLESLLLESEILELKANPNRVAIGTIIESKIDIGRGPVATVLVQNGTLSVGDPFVSGVFSGRVRALFNDRGFNVDKAFPSTPVEVLGLDGVPEAGDPFNALVDEKGAKQIAQKRQELQKVNKARDVKKITLDDLSRQIKEGEIKDLKIVLKGDVQGSIEAIKDAFEKLSNEEVNVKVIHSSTGAINENDVMLASASNAIIFGFHVHPNSKAALLAQREHVEIRKHSIIYDAINSVKSAMEGMLAPELREEITGQAEVRELFKVPKIGIIAGCYVTGGRILKSNRVRVIRDGIEVYEGDILALKRFKDDVTEVKDQFECGISIQNYQDLKVGDVIEGFLIKEIAKTLS